MSAPVVILPPSAALGIEARSKVERQALFHVAGSGLWARNGVVVRLRPMMGALVLALAAARGRALAYGALIDAVHGDDPEGGPLDPLGSFKVLRSGHKADLTTLGIDIEAWRGSGYRLVTQSVRTPPRRSADTFDNPTTAHWLPHVEAMLSRGASVRSAAKAVGRSHVTVLRALGRIPAASGRATKRTRTVDEMRIWRLRRDARQEAIDHGMPVSLVYERWGCGPAERSRLWDQRRAAASEASP